MSRTVSLYSGAKVAQVSTPPADQIISQIQTRRKLPTTPGEASVVQLVGQVVGREVAVQEREHHEAEERDHEQDPGEVAEGHAHAGAEDVEEPDSQDQADGDQVRQPDVHCAGAEVALTGGAPERLRSERLVREPRGLGDLATEKSEEGEDDRPPDPVTEGRDRADEGRVLAPPFVRVEREAPRLVREHRRELRVQHHDGHDHCCGDRPEEHRPPAAHVADRVTEGSEEEARIRERDHKSVVPAERLDEMPFLDDCLGHEDLLVRRVVSYDGRRPYQSPQTVSIA